MKRRQAKEIMKKLWAEPTDKNYPNYSKGTISKARQVMGKDWVGVADTHLENE